MSPAPAAPPARRHRAARSAGGAGRICLPHPRCMALLLAGSGHHRQRARPGRRLHERLHERDGRRRIAVADGGRRRQLVRRAPPTAHSPAQPAPSVRHADSARCCLRSRRSGANQTLFPAASSGARLEGEDEAAVSSAAGDGGADPVRRPPLAPRPSPLAPPLAHPSSTARWRCRGSDTCALLFQTRNFAGNPTPVPRSTVRAVFAAAPARATPLERLRANFVVPDSAFFPRIN